MNKKNILTAAVSLSLVACLSIGATLAYFTDKTEVAQNVFTTGKVDIELIDRLPEDYSDEDHTWKAVDNGDNTGIEYTDVMPGDYLQKEVGFSTAADSKDCYVAIRVETEVTSLPHANGKLTAQAAAAQLSDLIREQVEEANGSVWYVSDSIYDQPTNVDTYFFRTSVPAGTNNVMLFDGIQIPGEEWGNEYAEMEFNVKVQAAAIQADNTTLDTLMDMSWDELTSLE